MKLTLRPLGGASLLEELKNSIPKSDRLIRDNGLLSKEIKFFQNINQKSTLLENLQKVLLTIKPTST